MKKAALLLRVSRELQEMTSQREALLQDAKEQGFYVPEEYIFQEKITGMDINKANKDERRSLQELKTAIEKNGDIEIVYIWELTRLSRNPVFLIKNLDWFNQHEIPLYIHDNNWRTRKEENNEEDMEITNKIIGASTYGQLELEKIKERTRRGRLTKAKNNNFVGHLSDGYCVIIENGAKLIGIDQPRAEVIRRIFQLYIQGNSTNRIAELLNSEEIPTTNKYRALHPSSFGGYKETYKPAAAALEKDRKAALWTGSSITAILSNEWYMGIRHYLEKKSENKKVYIELPTPAIISLEIWNKVVSMREEKSIKRTRTSKVHTYLLANLLYCGNCGAKMYGHTTGLNNHYYCSSYESKSCGSRGVNKENIEASVYQITARRAWNDTICGEKNELTDFFRANEQSIELTRTRIKENKQIIAKATKEQDRLTNKIGALTSMAADAFDNRLRYEAAMAQIEVTQNEYNQAVEKCTQLEAENKKLEAKIKSLKDAKTALSKISTQKDLPFVRELFLATIEKVVVYNASVNSNILRIHYKNGICIEFIYSHRMLGHQYIELPRGEVFYQETTNSICAKEYPFYINGGAFIYGEPSPIMYEEDPTSYMNRFDEPLQVDEFIRQLKGTEWISSFERLEGLSELAQEQRQHYQEWSRKHRNTGRPTSEPYVLRDKNYEQICLERKHLYNRKYKIKKNKSLTPEEKTVLLEEIEEKLNLLAAQIKYLPNSRKNTHS